MTGSIVCQPSQVRALMLWEGLHLRVCGREAFRHSLSRLKQNVNGSLSIEFALISVPFLGLLCTIIETGLILMLGMGLDNTTQNIARLIKTGQLRQFNVTSADDFRSRVLCPASGSALLPAYLNCNRLTVDIRTAASLSSADLTNDFYKGGTSFCLGAPQSIVIVRLAYAFPALLPVLVVVSNGSGVSTAGLVNDVPSYPGWNHLLFNAAAFQNEAYANSAAVSCS